MRESGDGPEKQGWGLDFRSPAARGQEPSEYSFSPSEPEEFPRLADTPPPKPHGTINGAWGWAVLLVPILLLGSFAFIPSSETSDEESSGDTLGVIIFLLVWFGPYLAGAAAAFRGSRRGITWTFPVTCLFALFILIIPIGEPAGAWIAGTYTFGIAGFALHFAARKQTGKQRSVPGQPGISLAS